MISKMNLRKCLVFLALIIFTISVFSQDFPAKPVPPRLVNDFTGTLTNEQTYSLENKLVAFSDSTSTQIAIVMVSDLKGYDKTDYAVRLAQSWGIGQAGSDNGVLILVKPKTATSNGETVIITGYGLEGAIPDLTCGEIVDKELLPAFRQNDYYGGLESATTVLMSLARGEFSANDYSGMAGGSKRNAAPLVFLIIFFIIMMASSSGRNKHSSISKSGLPLWVLLGMMNSSGRSHSGSWGGFSSGSGGGGFGGFGGGGFGGGGAGGSW